MYLAIDYRRKSYHQEQFLWNMYFGIHSIWRYDQWWYFFYYSYSFNFFLSNNLTVWAVESDELYFVLRLLSDTFYEQQVQPLFISVWVRCDQQYFWPPSSKGFSPVFCEAAGEAIKNYCFMQKHSTEKLSRFLWLLKRLWFYF